MLGRLPKGAVLSTGELAARLVGVAISTTEKPPKCVGKAAKLLAKMAPRMKGFATHDGAVIVASDGSSRRRWRWHGQGKE
jgi:hypothetical protein